MLGLRSVELIDSGGDSAIKQVAHAALLFSFAIEFSQFHHAPWIDNLRATALGGLVVGFGIKVSLSRDIINPKV